jgi:hypothetical protein
MRGQILPVLRPRTSTQIVTDRDDRMAARRSAAPPRAGSWLRTRSRAGPRRARHAARPCPGSISSARLSSSTRCLVVLPLLPRASASWDRPSCTSSWMRLSAARTRSYPGSARTLAFGTFEIHVSGDGGGLHGAPASCQHGAALCGAQKVRSQPAGQQSHRRPSTGACRSAQLRITLCSA